MTIAKVTSLAIENHNKSKPGGFVALLKGNANVNRYVIAAALMVVATFTGPMHFNWVSVRSMLERMGTYSNLCEPIDSNSTSAWDFVIDESGTCPAQRKAIGSIMTTIVVCQFGLSLLSGQLSDRFSPKIVSLSGLLIQGTGWILVIQSRPTFPLYLLGASFIGLGQDMSFLPLIGTRDLFPGRESTIISILGTGRSLAAFGPIIIENISGQDNTRLIFTVFILIFQIYSLITVYICVPWNGFKDMPDIEANAAKTPSEETLSKRTRIKKAVLYNFRQMARPAFFIFVPYAVCCIMRPTWQGMIANDILDQALTAFSFASALSFIPCPIFGFLVDRIGIYPVLHIINAAAITMLSCSIVCIQAGRGNAIAAQYTVAFMFGIIQSFIVSQIYCYVQTCFKPEDTGKIIGIMCCIAGLSNLAVQPIYDSSLRSGFIPGTAGFIVFSSLGALMIGFLQFQLRTRKTLK